MMRLAKLAVCVLSCTVTVGIGAQPPLGEPGGVSHGLAQLTEKLRSSHTASTPALQKTQATMGPPIGGIVPQVPTDPVSQGLKKRTEERWKTLIQHDYAGAYAFEAPEYRSKVTREVFSKGFGSAVRWKGVQVVDLRYNGPDSAEVSVAVECDAVSPWGDGVDSVRIQTVVPENWKKVADQWWHVPSRSKLDGTVGKSSISPNTPKKSP